MTEKPADRVDGRLLRLIGVMVLGGAMSTLDATIVNVGIDTISAHFHTILSTTEWISTGYLLAVSVAIPLAGWAVDRFGAKRMWLIGLCVFLAGSALASIAWDPGSLIAFRILQGFGGGLIDPIMMTVVARAAGPARMGRAMALLSIPITLGPVVGPVLGGLLIQHFGWRWIFLVNIPIALLAIAFALRAVPKDVPSAAGASPFDRLGVALLCPGFAALVYALSQAGTAGFGSARVLAALVVGAALFAGYIVHALRPGTTAALLDLRLFASRGFSGAVAAMFLLGGTLYSLLFLLPLYYQEVRGHTVLASGLLLAALGLGIMAGMPIAGNLADRIGAKGLVPLGGALVILGSVVYSQSTAHTSQVVLTAVQLLAGFGLGLIGAPTMGSVYRSVPPEKAAAATGAVFILNTLGASLGISVVALILQNGSKGTAPGTATTFGHAFWWPAAAGLAVVAAGLLLPGRPAQAADAELPPAEAELEAEAAEPVPAGADLPGTTARPDQGVAL